MNMKDAVITYLKEMNKGKGEGVITRLYYNNGKDYVEDFSYFANDKYMSNELLTALKYAQTLTTDQQKELNCFIVEASMD